jgi:pimeloyl-ACP methyl ester carboxylesterase
MKHTVLLFISGAWHGAWVWQRLSRALLDNGVLSFSFDTKGSGMHAPKEGNLSADYFGKTDQKDVSFVAENTFKNRLLALEKQLVAIYQTIGPVVLVSHSLGGLFASQLMENHYEKICKSIFINGYMLSNNQCAADFLNLSCMKGCLIPEILIGDFKKIRTARIAVQLKNHCYNNRLRSILYGNITDHDFLYALRQLHTDEPLDYFSRKLKLSLNKYGRIKRYYISCTQDVCVPYLAQTHLIKAMDSWSEKETKIYTLEAGHTPMFSQPDLLKKIIEEIALLQK